MEFIRVDRALAVIASEALECRVADDGVNPSTGWSSVRIEISRIPQNLNKSIVDDVFRPLAIAQNALRNSTQSRSLATIDNRRSCITTGGALEQSCLILKRWLV